MELFSFLTKELTNNFHSNLLVITKGEMVHSNTPLELNDLMPCGIEEANERFFLHLKRAAEENVDVVVIARLSSHFWYH